MIKEKIDKEKTEFKKDIRKVAIICVTIQLLISIFVVYLTGNIFLSLIVGSLGLIPLLDNPRDLDY